MRRVNGTRGVYFTLEQLKVFILTSLASLCCGYLGAPPIPYIHDAMLNLPNLYLRSTTVLLDNTVTLHCTCNDFSDHHIVNNNNATLYLPTSETCLSLRALFQVGVGKVNSSTPPTPRAPQSALPQHSIS